MKILLITFTGTFNTYLCAENIKKHFIKHGHEVDHYVYSSKESFKYQVNKYDLIGFGYPIHAFNTPKTFIKFIKTLPKVKGIKYFIYKVSGEPFKLNNASSALLVRKLKRKGYIKIAEKHFLMPYNIIFRYKDELMKQMYLYLDPLTKLYVNEIEVKEFENIEYSFFHRFISFIFRIEYLAPNINALFVRVKKKCINCNECIKNCPTEALYRNKDNKIRIKGSKCALCMRCTLNCPVDAFRFGFLNLWKVNGKFNYPSLIKNKDINPNFINHNTKGYFYKFNNYFDTQKALLKEFNIKDPLEDK